MFDFSEPTGTSSAKPSEPSPQPQTSNGLPPGITQKQLDEARAMQASMTKAGKKGRPKYDRHEEPTSEPAWAADSPEQTMVGDAYPSPAPSERETRISDWASEVNAQQSSTPQISSPVPTKVAPRRRCPIKSGTTVPCFSASAMNCVASSSKASPLNAT